MSVILNSSEKVVSRASVGNGKIHATARQTICCDFHDFAKLPYSRDKKILSPPLLCHGHVWKIQIFPGGHNQSNPNETFLSIFLGHGFENSVVRRSGSVKGGKDFAWQKQKEGDGIRVKFALWVGNWSKRYTRTYSSHEEYYGYADFLSRSAVLEHSNSYLCNGTLTVKADIQVYTNEPVRYTPQKTLQQDMLKMWTDGMHTDIVFFVVHNSTKTRFKAHRNILSFRAPSFLSLVEDVDPDEDVPIECVDPAVFRAILYFIYSDELPKDLSLKENARALLEAADRFGCSRLKLLAETELVRNGMDTLNVAELLLFADARNCALLRESAMNFICANPAAVMATQGWMEVKEAADILSELFGVLFGGKGNNVEDEKSLVRVSNEENNQQKVWYEDELRRFSVAELRRCLDERGLDLDGTKDMLIERFISFLENSDANLVLNLASVKAI